MWTKRTDPTGGRRHVPCQSPALRSVSSLLHNKLTSYIISHNACCPHSVSKQRRSCWWKSGIVLCFGFIFKPMVHLPTNWNDSESWQLGRFLLCVALSLINSKHIIDPSLNISCSHFISGTQSQKMKSIKSSLSFWVLFFPPHHSSHNTAKQQQQHSHTLSRLSSPSLWSISSVLLSSGTIGAVVRKERGHEWTFPGSYKASSFLLDEGHGQPAPFTVWPGRRTWMINAGLLCFIHFQAFSFPLSASSPPGFICLVTVKNATGHLALVGSFQEMKGLKIDNRKQMKD